MKETIVSHGGNVRSSCATDQHPPIPFQHFFFYAHSIAQDSETVLSSFG